MYTLQEFESFPRLGWLSEASPVHGLPALAAQLGLRELWVKRDDKIPELGGGNKVRKLDYLLAQPLYQGASDWHASGAIGSSQLLVAARAARSMGRGFTAHACGQPFAPEVMQTLAQLQATASQVVRYHNRATMALSNPSLVLRDRSRGAAIIPPGATSPTGNLGFVRAGLELAQQIRAGELPCPDRVYVGLGSGGTAVGLAMGLALAGIQTQVRAISVVEAVFVNRVRIAGLIRRLTAPLEAGGVLLPDEHDLSLAVDTSCVGSGYAHPSKDSLGACELLRGHGLALDPVYTGKAMAALLRDASDMPASKLLFWHTGFRLHDDSQGL
ncbi:MAG: pyridoxal-phosphate dependent enzyme [Kofleriaceae bacterium]|nr:pyridoxal-phosphate dependent enzyme [Kofleriaceae bacterium]